MFHFDKHFGLFIGPLMENRFHKHYALQISVSIGPHLAISYTKDNIHTCSSVFIKAKTTHQLTCDTDQLTILINPLSTLGHQLYLQYGGKGKNWQDDKYANQISILLEKNNTHKITFTEFCQEITALFNDFQLNSSHNSAIREDRILKALDYLENNVDRVVSLEEIANYCHLSPTRFLHLFKEKTDINFRRYQLWNRSIKSIPFLRSNSITATAHQFGFTDSSHYTRTFIETFGVTPKFFSSLK